MGVDDSIDDVVLGGVLLLLLLLLLLLRFCEQWVRWRTLSILLWEERADWFSNVYVLLYLDDLITRLGLLYKLQSPYFLFYL